MGVCINLRRCKIAMYGSAVPDIPEEPTASMYLYGRPSESGNIGLRDGDTVTYYDGAVLPELPEWDKTAYPYAYIVRRTISSGTYYYLRVSVGTQCVDGTCYAALDLDDGVSYLAKENGWSKSSGGAIGHMVWSNFDVNYIETVEAVGGTLYMSATDPIPVTRVGNSYNGTVLPELPETDLPYAFIRNIGDGYSVIFMSVQPTIDNLGISIHYENATTEHYRNTDNGWVYDSGGESKTGSFLISQTIWGNVEVNGASGYFAKSPEPIPVYE